MADRSITLRLSANVSGLQAGLRTAARATRDFERDVSSFASRNEEHFDRTGKASMAIGVGLLAGVALAVKASSEFDSAMSEVRASTHETAGNMDLLREAAVNAGADTAFSAKEAANGIDELAKAGVSTKDILGGGLKGALSLAAAGSLGVADAAEIAASALTQFKLSGDQIPHLADLLAAGAGKAQGSVQDMGAALNQTGLVAASTGLSIEETTGGLAAFASAGLVGSDAGTSFKSMLQRLTPQSLEAKNKMAELGISAYDAQGQFIGLAKFSENLKTSMADLTPEARNAAMGVIFGSDAVRAANVLYEQGGKGISDWTDKVNEAGYAAVTAAIKQDNLAGDIEKLGGSFDSLLIKSGGGVAESLRGIVQGAEDMVDALGKIPAPALSAGLGIAGITGAGLLLGGAVMTALPKIAEFRGSLDALAPAGSRARGALVGVGKAAGVAAAAMVVLQVGGALFSEKDKKTTEDYGQALLRVGNAAGSIDGAGLDSLFQGWDKNFGAEPVSKVNNMTDAVREFANQDLNDVINQGFADPLNSLFGFSKTHMGQITDRFKDLGDEMGNLASNGGAETAAKSFQALTKEFEKNGKGAQEALDALPGYKDALMGLANQARVDLEPHELLDLAMGKIPASMKAAQGATETYTNAAGQSAPVSEEMAGALEGVGLAASGAVTDIEAFTKSLFAAGLLHLSASDAAIAYEAAIDDMSASVAKNGTTLDKNTEQGRANQSAYNGLAQAAMATAEATAAETLASEGAAAAQAGLQGALQGSYNDLVTAAGQLGITGAAADEMARKALGIPKDVPINTWVNDQASQKLRDIKGEADGLNGKTVNIYANTHKTTFEKLVHLPTGNSLADGSYGQGLGVLAPGHATGGPISGPGTGTSDDIPAWLSNGEHVWTAEEVRRAGGHGAVESLRSLALKGLPAFATGGRVGWSDRGDDRAAKVAAAATNKREALASARWHAQQAYDKIGSSAKNKARKAAANRALKAAEKRLTSAENAEDRAKEKLRDAKEQTARLSESTRDLKTDVRRGDIIGSVMSGSGLSVVDRLRDESRNKDLSTWQRGNLGRIADSSEKQLLSMEKRSESLASKLEKAKSKYDDLVSIQSGVASGLKSEQSISGFMGLIDDKAAAKAQKNLDKVTAKHTANLDKIAAKLEAARDIQAELLATRDGVASGLQSGFSLAGAVGLMDEKAAARAQKNLDKVTAKHEKSLEKITGKLEAARAIQSDLYAVRDSVSSGLQGGFSLSGVLGLMDEKAAAKAQQNLEKVTGRHEKSLDKITAKLEAARTIQSDLYSVRDGVASGLQSGFSLSGVLGLVDEKAAGALGQRTEKAQAGLDKITGKLDAARGKLESLRATRDGIMGGLQSEQSLGSALGQENAFGYDKPVTSKSLIGGAKSKLAAIKSFAGKLQKLRGLGLSSVILEEVAGLGSEDGSEVADALIKGGASDVKTLNSAYAGIEMWGRRAGAAVSDSMYKGGIGAAKNLVNGLKSQQGAATKALSALATPDATGKLTASGMVKKSTSMANQIKSFAAKLDKLRKRGVSGVILEEIAGMGVEDGMRTADALLAGSKGSIKDLNAQYERIEMYSQRAGRSVAGSMYKGGVSAANSLVAGLESQQSKVEATLAGLATPDANGKITAKGLVSNASGMASRIKSFAGKLAKLQKEGLSGSILEEIAGMGVDEGSRVADALLSGSRSDVRNLNKSYDAIAMYSQRAGRAVASGMYKGGVSAANSLVAGLESQQGKAQSALAALATPDVLGKVTAKGLVSKASGMASRIKSFAGKLAKLQKEGLSGVILEEIAGMGVEEGSRVADALISGSGSDVRNLNKSYEQIAMYSQRAGRAVANSMYKGGIGAANSLVAGLESRQSKVQSTLESLIAPDATGKVTASGMAKGAKGVADKISKFASKLDKLRKRGVDGIILEEIASMGTEEGMRAADALLAGSGGSIKELNTQYRRIDKYSQKAGLSVTKGFYEGGVNAAKGLVAGLEDQQGAIEKQMLKIANGMQAALKRALGIHSPSKVMQKLMHHVGDGAVIGLEDKRPDLESAMAAMVSVPDASFGSWSGMAQSGSGMSAPVMELSAADRALMSQFITASQSMPPMNLLVNGRQAGAIVQEGNKAVRTLK